MSQVQTGPEMGPTAWYQCHESDYNQVLQRLSDVREITLCGDISRAADVLKKSYVNAVMSIKTKKDRHERAFTSWAAGEKTLQDSLATTVYGNQKGDWVARTMEQVDWDMVAAAVQSHVRNGRWEELLAMSEKDLVGVSHTKWSFTLAMAGIWELCCIDSNVSQYLGDGPRAEANGAGEYLTLIRRVSDTVRADIPPFICQWVIYDMQRGEHARHMAFFREVFYE